MAGTDPWSAVRGARDDWRTADAAIDRVRLVHARVVALREAAERRMAGNEEIADAEAALARLEDDRLDYLAADLFDVDGTEVAWYDRSMEAVGANDVDPGVDAFAVALSDYADGNGTWAQGNGVADTFAAVVDHGGSGFDAADVEAIDQLVTAFEYAVEAAVRHRDAAADALQSELSAVHDGGIDDPLTALDGHPIAMLPVHLETRFVEPGDASTADADQLWIRVYPDQLHVDSHEEGLTDDEVTWGRTFWATVWFARHPDPTRPDLNDPDGSYLQSALPNRRLRELVADLDVEGFTQVQGGYDAAAHRARYEQFKERAWRQVIDRFGRERAAYVVHSLAPDGLAGELLTPPPESGDPPDAPGSLSFPAPDRKAEPWTKQSRARLLPDRWVALAEWTDEEGTERRTTATSDPVREPLAVGLDVESVVDPEEDGNDPAPPGLEWMVDFEDAEDAGMGLRIDLDDLEGFDAEDGGFERLFVLGVKASMEETGASLADLFDAHHYTDGLEFLPQGTPTNNHDMASGYTSEDDHEASMGIEVGPPLVEDGDWSDGDLLARALAVDPISSGRDRHVFGHVENADGVEQLDARHANAALWPATIGYYLQHVLVPDLWTDLAIGETNRVRTDQPDDNTWHPVAISGSYSDPVVIAGPVSNAGDDPCHVRLRNVGSRGGAADEFEFQFEEWDYLDGTHAGETVSYLVAEAGVHALADGRTVEVGTVQATHEFASVGFDAAFDGQPVVVTQSQTKNGGDPIVTRNRNVTGDGFEVRLQEQEEKSGSGHTTETVGYVAIEPGDGKSGLAIEAGTLADVDHEWHRLAFDGDDVPLLVADLQTYDGDDTAGLRYEDGADGSVRLTVEEEASTDDETDHLPEDVGYVAFDRSGAVVPASVTADLAEPLARIAGLRRHFERYVRGRGPLPTLRVGRQPYGVLPAASLRTTIPDELFVDDDGPGLGVGDVPADDLDAGDVESTIDGDDLATGDVESAIDEVDGRTSTDDVESGTDALAPDDDTQADGGGHVPSGGGADVDVVAELTSLLTTIDDVWDPGTADLSFVGGHTGDSLTRTLMREGTSTDVLRRGGIAPVETKSPAKQDLHDASVRAAMDENLERFGLENLHPRVRGLWHLSEAGSAAVDRRNLVDEDVDVFVQMLLAEPLERVRKLGWTLDADAVDLSDAGDAWTWGGSDWSSFVERLPRRGLYGFLYARLVDAIDELSVASVPEWHPGEIVRAPMTSTGFGTGDGGTATTFDGTESMDAVYSDLDGTTAGDVTPTGDDGSSLPDGGVSTASAIDPTSVLDDLLDGPTGGPDREKLELVARLYHGYGDLGLPTSLLRVLLYYGLNQEYLSARLRLARLLDDPPSVGPEPATYRPGDPTPYGELFEATIPDEVADDRPDVGKGDTYATALRSGAADVGGGGTSIDATLSEYTDSLAYLAGRDEAALTELLPETLDLASHRLDAWWTSLATRRLFEMRTGQGRFDPDPGPGYGQWEPPTGIDVDPGQPPVDPTAPVDGGTGGDDGNDAAGDDTLSDGGGGVPAESPADDVLPGDGADGGPPVPASAGIYVGAYGYVENLQKDVEGPDYRPEYVQAPSTGHSTTAALLRSGYLAHRDEDADMADALSVDLSADRLRGALSLIEGVRRGRSLGELLGYRFERRLHQVTVAGGSTGPNLNGYRPVFRQAFPLDRDARAAREVAAEGRVDGLALVRNWDQYPFGEPDLPAIGSDAYERLDEIVAAGANSLADSLDAAGDLLTAESVHQLAQGNFQRAGHSVDTLAKGEAPPELEVIETPRSETGLVHRQLALLEAPSERTPAHSPDASARRIRAEVEPALESWVADLLPDPADVECLAEYHWEDDSGTEHVVERSAAVTLATLDYDLSALDVLALFGGQEGTELERRLAFPLLRNRPAGVPADAEVEFSLAETDTDGAVSVAELLELAGTLDELIGRTRPATAADLGHPATPETAGHDGDTVAALEARADAAQDHLLDLGVALDEHLSIVDPTHEFGAAMGDVHAGTPLPPGGVESFESSTTGMRYDGAEPQPAGDETDLEPTVLQQVDEVAAALTAFDEAVPLSAIESVAAPLAAAPECDLRSELSALSATLPAGPTDPDAVPEDLAVRAARDRRIAGKLAVEPDLPSLDEVNDDGSDAGGQSGVGKQGTLPLDDLEADLPLSVSVEASGPFRVGGRGEYVVRVCNDGDEPWTDGVVVADDLPDDARFTDASGTGWSVGLDGDATDPDGPWSGPADDGGWAVCTHANDDGLAPGECLPELVVSVEFDPTPEEIPPGGSEVDHVVAAGTPRGPGDGLATDEVAHPVDGAAAIGIDPVDRFVVGAQAEYVLRVSNWDDHLETVADVHLALPDGIEFLGGSGDGWDCEETGGTVVCSHDEDHLPPGDRLPDLHVEAAVQPAESYAGGDRPAVRAAFEAPPDVADPAERFRTTHAVDYGLAVDVAAADEFYLGGSGTYAIEVSNETAAQRNGPVELVLALPDGTNLASATGPDWQCSASGGLVACEHENLGGLSPGASLPALEIEVEVDPVDAFPSDGDVACCVGVRGPPADVEPANRSCVTHPVHHPLAIDVGVADRFDYDGDGEYAIAVRNRGEEPWDDPVTVLDELPDGVTVVSATGAGWSITGQDGDAIAVQHSNVDGLAPGERLPELRLAVDVDAADRFFSGDPVANRASVADSSGEVVARTTVRTSHHVDVPVEVQVWAGPGTDWFERERTVLAPATGRFEAAVDFDGVEPGAPFEVAAVVDGEVRFSATGRVLLPATTLAAATDQTVSGVLDLARVEDGADVNFDPAGPSVDATVTLEDGFTRQTSVTAWMTGDRDAGFPAVAGLQFLSSLADAGYVPDGDVAYGAADFPAGLGTTVATDDLADADGPDDEALDRLLSFAGESNFVGLDGDAVADAIDAAGYDPTADDPWAGVTDGDLPLPTGEPRTDAYERAVDAFVGWYDEGGPATTASAVTAGARFLLELVAADFRPGAGRYDAGDFEAGLQVGFVAGDLAGVHCSDVRQGATPGEFLATLATEAVTLLDGSAVFGAILASGYGHGADDPWAGVTDGDLPLPMGESRTAAFEDAVETYYGRFPTRYAFDATFDLSSVDPPTTVDVTATVDSATVYRGVARVRPDDPVETLVDDCPELRRLLWLDRHADLLDADGAAGRLADAIAGTDWSTVADQRNSIPPDGTVTADEETAIDALIDLEDVDLPGLHDALATAVEPVDRLGLDGLFDVTGPAGSPGDARYWFTDSTAAGDYRARIRRVLDNPAGYNEGVQPALLKYDHESADLLAGAPDPAATAAYLDAFLEHPFWLVQYLDGVVQDPETFVRELLAWLYHPAEFSSMTDDAAFVARLRGVASSLRGASLPHLAVTFEDLPTGTADSAAGAFADHLDVVADEIDGATPSIPPVAGERSTFETDHESATADLTAVATQRTPIAAATGAAEPLDDSFRHAVLDGIRVDLLSVSYYGVQGSVPDSPAGRRPGDEVDLVESTYAVLSRVRERLLSAIALDPRRGEYVAPARTDERVDDQVDRIQVLFGESVTVLPPFVPANGPELRETFADQGLLSDGGSLAVETWLQRTARVRDRPATFRDATTLAGALSGTQGRDLRVGQLPYREDDDWIGLDGVDPESGRVSLVAQFGPNAGAADVDGRVAGLFVDEWVETVPDEEETTGIALNYDDPGNRAPQSVLLAVPPEDGRWSTGELASVVAETTEMMKLRALDLGDLEDLEIGLTEQSARRIGETGRVTTDQPDATTWHTEQFSNSYADPVVVMKPPGHAGANPCHVRLRNVGSRGGGADGFEFQFEEWEYLDGTHAEEAVSYVVLERGTHRLPDGRRVEVGTVEATHEFASVTFAQDFVAAPVVFSQSQTRNGDDPVVTRNRNVTNGGFEVRVQEEEETGGEHTTETVGYVAVESGQGDDVGPEDLTYEVGRADEVDDEWTRIDFAGSDPTSGGTNPAFLADLQTYGGTDTAGLRYESLDEQSVDVFVEEEKSAHDEMDHVAETVGYAVFEPGADVYGTYESFRFPLPALYLANHPHTRGSAPTPSVDPRMPEWYELTDGSGVVGETKAVTVGQQADTTWHPVQLSKAYTDPVVVMNPVSDADPEPCHVRLRNVGSRGGAADEFEFQLEEWDSLDGTHAEETVSYVVMEQGTFTLGDGWTVEAGTVEVNLNEAEDEVFTSVAFGSSFESTPVVLAQSQTKNGGDAVVTRVRDVTEDGFEVRLQEQEATGGWHTTEVVGYVAIEPGRGESGVGYEAGTLAGVTDEFEELSFQGDYGEPPRLVAGVQTYEDDDAAGLRYRDLTASSAAVRVDEERSADEETGHAPETVGYLAFDRSGAIRAEYELLDAVGGDGGAGG